MVLKNKVLNSKYFLYSIISVFALHTVFPFVLAQISIDHCTFQATTKKKKERAGLKLFHSTVEDNISIKHDPCSNVTPFFPHDRWLMWLLLPAWINLIALL